MVWLQTSSATSLLTNSRSWQTFAKLPPSVTNVISSLILLKLIKPQKNKSTIHIRVSVKNKVIQKVECHITPSTTGELTKTHIAHMHSFALHSLMASCWKTQVVVSDTGSPRLWPCRWPTALLVCSTSHLKPPKRLHNQGNKRNPRRLTSTWMSSSLSFFPNTKLMICTL